MLFYIMQDYFLFFSYKMEDKQPIGLIIKDIIERKNLSIKRLTDKSGKYRQFFYDTYKRSSMSVDDMEWWADLLDISLSELMGKSISYTNPTNPDSGISHPDYLLDFLTRIEEKLEKQYQGQLEAKDNQIKDLSETVKTLLGKSEGTLFEGQLVGAGAFSALYSAQQGVPRANRS